MANPKNTAELAALKEKFEGASSVFLTEYRGLTVKQISALRTALGADTSYAVVKNTLTKIAAGEAGLEGVDALLTGPTAVAFINGEPVEAAKALCVPCPLREACLAGALQRREPWGVWGGQLVVAGVVVPRKRPRGRPRKVDVAA